MPLPEPEDIVIQEIFAEVLQLHAVWVVMDTFPDPPVAEKDAFKGVMVNEQEEPEGTV